MDLQLTTKRLTLRPLLMSDVGLVIEMFTDQKIMKYAGGVIPEEKIDKEMALYIRRGAKGCLACGASVIERTARLWALLNCCLCQ